MADLTLPRHRPTLALLLGLTLLCSAVHFADNAFRLDLYPGPAWLTRNAILWTWTLLPALAFLAWQSGSRVLLCLYASLGFAGFAHFAAPHHHPLPARCFLTVCAEAAASLALIAFVSLPARTSRAGGILSAPQRSRRTSTPLSVTSLPKIHASSEATARLP